MVNYWHWPGTAVTFLLDMQFTHTYRFNCITFIFRGVFLLCMLWENDSNTTTIPNPSLPRPSYIPVCQKGNWPLVSVFISHWSHTGRLYYNIVDNSYRGRKNINCKKKSESTNLNRKRQSNYTPAVYDAYIKLASIWY